MSTLTRRAPALLLLALCVFAADQPAGVFPMAKGTRWIYRGTVAWQGEGPGAGERHKALEWKTELLDSVQRGRLTLALLRGHPSDLTWYEEGRQPGCYLLTVVDGRDLYFRELQTGCALPPADPATLPGPEDLFLKIPAQAGDTFAGDPRRDDAMYAWHVDEKKPARLSAIKGIPAGPPRTAYVVAYRTNPDHQFVTFVPGIGFTSYVYGHHGTLSEVDMKLVEFRAAP